MIAQRERQYKPDNILEITNVLKSLDSLFPFHSTDKTKNISDVIC